MEPKPSDHPKELPVSLDGLFQQFKEMLEQHIQESWEPEEARTHFESLAESMETLTPALLAIGEEAAEAVAQNSTDFTPWFINYEWMDYAKSFLVLWRDILFQEQKAWLKVSAGEVSTTQFQQLKTAAKQTVLEASSTLLIDLESASSHPLNTPKQLEKWRLQDSPWPVYKEQISQLPDHCDDLLQQSKILWIASGTFVIIGSHFIENYDTWLTQIDKLRKGLRELCQQLANQENIEGEALIEDLEHLNEAWMESDSAEIFHADLENYISRLPANEKIFAGAEGGLLLYKEVNLRKDVRSWLESELISDVYDLNTIRDAISNKINLSIVNVRNRLAEEEEKEQLTAKEAVEQILNNFLNSLGKSEEKIQELKRATEKNVQEHLAIAKIYDEGFLSQSFQYTITRYRDAARWLEIRNWIKDKGARVTQLHRNVRAEEALSISEKIVRVVKSRLPEEVNNHYTNMFLTQGWIGDSFMVGRELELKRVQTLIEDWKLGFRGAVLLTGKRFSGKSLFGDAIDYRFFRSKAVKLIPKSRLQVGTHQIKAGYDLKPVLKFISRYCTSHETLIWIDDLEHWHSERIPLAQNVNALLSFIDQHSSRLFFVVSTSNWMKAHLAQAFDVDKVFQSEVNLGSMSTGEIQQAILVRHSATHAELINEEGKEVEMSELNKSISRIYQQSEGNIGEALQHWAYNVERYDDGKILLKNTPTYELPLFLTTDSALLLRAIMMEKKTNRHLMRLIFGPAFITKYQVVLQRMFNLSIIEDHQGWLGVNPYLANDIAKQLSKKLDFQYSYSNTPKEQVKL